MMNRTWFAAAAAMALSGCAMSGSPEAEAPVSLVTAGVFKGRIYLPAQAAPEERDAARHLADWFRRVSGARAEIVEEPAGESAPGLYVGSTRAAARAGVVAPSSLSGECSVRATRRGDAVYLVGATPLATRQAAAAFSREVLGVGFLAPGLSGADWSQRRDIRVPAGDVVWRPAFAWRAITLGDTAQEREWALDNGFGRIPDMNHSLHAVFDAAVYAKHPELLPVINGERIAPSGRGGYEAQPNLAHPEAPKVAAAAALAYARRHPGAPAFSLGINDTVAWDESPMSAAAFGEPRWFRGRRNRTDYVFRFMNATARELDASGAPGLLLTAYAYYECEAPPSFPLHPRVFPVLTADRSEWRDAAFAAEDRALISAWAKSGCATFGVYDYYYGRDMAMPRVFYRAQAASVRHAAREGASLFFGEMMPDWGFDAPKAWLAARLAETPEADERALLDEYFERAYGAAAAPMRRFHELVERRWSERSEPPRWIRFYREESVATLFPPEVRRALRRELACARAALPEPEPGDARAWRRRARVLATALSWVRADAFAEWYEARAALEAMPVARDDAEALRVGAAYARCERLRREYESACARWAASPLNPGTAFDPKWLFGGRSEGSAAYRMGGRGGAVPGVAVRALSAGDAEVLMRESFEAADFAGAPKSGLTPVERETIAPKSPLHARWTTGRSGRLGPDGTRSIAGGGSLVVAACEQAAVARRFAVSPGDVLGSSVMYSGRITPGEHVAVYVRFTDASGAKLGEVVRGVAFPGGGDAWRPLAVVARAPALAAYADVALRVTSQDAGDAVWFDDWCVRRVPAEDAQAEGE